MEIPSKNAEKESGEDLQLDVPYHEGQNVEEKGQENDEPFQFKGSKRSGLRRSIKTKRYLILSF